MTRLKAFIFLAIISVLLVGCGKKDITEEIIGDWVVTGNDLPIMLFSFDERDIQFFSVNDQQTNKFGYEITEDNKKDGTFRVTAFERNVDYREKIFSGKFKNNNVIELFDFAGVSDEEFEEANFTMMRIKDFEKEQEKAVAVFEKALEKIEKEEEIVRKETEKQAAKEAEKAEKERIEQEKQMAKEQQQKAEQPAPTEEKAETPKNPNNQQELYKQKAQAIDDRMLEDHMAAYPGAHDMDYPFLSQYFTDWDDLLQEIWGVLREEMPADAFETLKAEQIEWIREKEAQYGGDPGTAIERAEQFGRETAMTQTRVYELIEGYLD